jgi:hypothetical protein
VNTLKEYEVRTRPLRTEELGNMHKLLLAIVKPHKPVAASTIARWLCGVLELAGIDTGTFKAHSTRGAAASAAASAGMSVTDILKTADWSSESTFTQFYYKEIRSTDFGDKVLSSKKS